MPFSPIPDLLDDIRAGRMVVILDDEDRENEGDLIMAASKVRPEDINFMARHARGLICLALTRERCRQLDLPLMVRENRSQFSTSFTVSIEAAEGVTTGISAYDRAHTIRTAVMPDARPEHLHQPGHIFPLMAQPGGVLVRAGHTEAAVDLAGLAGLEPAGVLVEVMAEDGSMARRAELEAFASEHGLKVGTIADLIHFRQQHEKTIERVYDQPVETSFGPFRLVGYRDLIGHELHFALVRGEPRAEEPVLVRVHVKNPLSDVLHLEREDLGLPLSAALRQVAQAGTAVVVVLTRRVEPDALLRQLMAEPAPSSERGSDWRRHGLGAQILVDLGVRRMRVLGTPRRFSALGGFGLEVVEYADPASPES
ncbi:MAG TPA: bifunctional 3,4-dihydroxy-2-butanone-4-phosphate synthase/GTP cyclohydrolase II [Xanthomonadaceae bacterium]|nr:bifunctional 3,4-dihydroxy-2-butanone-4-phosphate synthase/GTP cyclohydrolase II [Xanthomonadaceae bacterium]